MRPAAAVTHDCPYTDCGLRAGGDARAIMRHCFERHAALPGTQTAIHCVVPGCEGFVFSAQHHYWQHMYQYHRTGASAETFDDDIQPDEGNWDVFRKRKVLKRERERDMKLPRLNNDDGQEEEKEEQGDDDEDQRPPEEEPPPRDDNGEDDGLVDENGRYLFEWSSMGDILAQRGLLPPPGDPALE